ncbi:MAG: DUF5990 family protein [Sphingomonas sp.]
MARPPQIEIRMRLVVENPVAGVFHSLQDKGNSPVDTKQSVDGQPLAFDFAIRIADGPKFFGEQVRSEGPERRFVYIAVGSPAGQHVCEWSRRMKIDIHDIPQALLDKAAKGGVLEGRLNGTGKDGTPACATIRPIDWRIAS